jgi:quercetin dioxygenase-like cupin family protein
MNKAATTNSTDLAQFRAGFRFRRARNCISAVTLATLLGGFLFYMRSAVAQAPPLTFELLAGGFSPDHRVHINAKGPSDILQTKIVVQPGGDTGWHTHPGPVIVVVKTGAATEFHSNGCVSVHPAGSVFFESEGEVHKVINETSP